MRERRLAGRESRAGEPNPRRVPGALASHCCSSPSNNYRCRQWTQWDHLAQLHPAYPDPSGGLLGKDGKKMSHAVNYVSADTQ